MAYAPPVTLHNYTNTHATHSNVPWSWTGLVPQFGRAFCFPASLSLGCVGRLGWVFVSPAPTGVGANRPPLTGGQLTSGVLVDVPPPVVRVRWRSAWCRILSRNLEFDPFSKSHSWAGYVCFVLLRECISVSVTYGDSCN